MKCHILISRKNKKKNIISLSSAESAHSMVNVKKCTDTLKLVLLSHAVKKLICY